MLGIISNLPSTEQIGLVETYHLGSEQIIQTMYPQDLKAIMEDQKQLKKLPTQQKLELIHQLSLGLKTLHESGINHADLKPANILIDLTKQNPKLAINDFDLAYLPKEHMNEDRPADGTPYMMAPEILKEFISSDPDFTSSDSNQSTWKNTWSGITNEERIENALKSDTYAAATIAYQMMKPGNTNWIKECVGPDDKSNLYKDFIKCQSVVLNRFIKEESKNPVLDPFDHLIAAAVNPDPLLRITSKVFEEGVAYLQSRSEINPTMSSISAKSPISMRSSTSARPSTSTMSSTSTRRPPSLSYYAQMTDSDAQASIKGRNAGTYLVHRGEATEKDSLTLTFIDRQGLPRSKLLKINPNQPLELQNEIQFLTAIGTLKTTFGNYITPAQNTGKIKLDPLKNE